MEDFILTSNAFKTRMITVAAVLTAVGIIIPMIMPFKVVIGPASYTLGSHVPINMAMFISPLVAAVVSLGTAIGFQAAGFPAVIVARAFTHVFYSSIGAIVLEKNKELLAKTGQRYFFNFIINIIHAIGEVAIVYAFTALGMSQQSDNFLYVLFVLVGLGTLIHGMIDFELAYQFTKLIHKRTSRTFINFA